MGFLAEIEYGKWRMWIGDPTVMGWITFSLYLITAVICWKAVKKHKTDNKREASFWLLFTVLFIMLGLNKELDLHSLLNEIGSAMAKEQGWWESRFTVKKIFLAGVAFLGAVALYFLSRYYNNIWQANKLAAAGLIMIGIFILIRGLSFQGYENLKKASLLGIKLKWALELSGIGLVFAAAVKNLRKDQEQVEEPENPQEQ